LRAPRDLDPFHNQCTANRALGNYFDLNGRVVNEACGPQREQIDGFTLELVEFFKAYLIPAERGVRCEPEFWQAALERHLTAFEPNLVVAAGTGMLALVASTSRLAQARSNASAQALAGLFRAGRWFYIIQAHFQASLISKR
jgi:hypothetical protein